MANAADTAHMHINELKHMVSGQLSQYAPAHEMHVRFS